MHWRFAIIVCAFAVLPAHARAEAAHNCNERPTTVDIVECMADYVTQLDSTIETLVDEAASRGTPELGDAIKAAQNAWLAYRDAACLVIRLGEGTIAAIEAGECRLRLSIQRLEELKRTDG